MRQFLGVMCVFLISVNVSAGELALYHRYQKMTNIPNAQSDGVRFIDRQPSATIMLAAETKRWNLGTEKDGQSIEAAIYQDWGPRLTQVLQVQLGSSTLYPALTAAYELGYKVGANKSCLLGIGGGQQQFSGGDKQDFLKVGPTLYFSQGYLGYRYTDYSGSGKNHVVFTEWKINPSLRIDLLAQQGEGGYQPTWLALPVGTVNVKGKDMDLSIAYLLSAHWEGAINIGKTTVDNKNGSSIYKSDNAMLAVKYMW